MTTRQRVAAQGANEPESTEAATTDEPTQDREEQSSSGSRGTIKYTGDAGVREISKADWRAAGIDHPPVVWDASNDYTLPLSDFSSEAVELLRRDRKLKISQ